LNIQAKDIQANYPATLQAKDMQANYPATLQAKDMHVNYTEEGFYSGWSDRVTMISISIFSFSSSQSGTSIAESGRRVRPRTGEQL
jgi:hypothetical protein